MTAAVQDLPTEPLARPLRVVLFCGPVLERGMVRFAGLLEQHPETLLVRGALAEVYAAMGDSDKVLETLEGLAQINPGDLDAQKKVARIYLAQAQELQSELDLDPSKESLFEEKIDHSIEHYLNALGIAKGDADEYIRVASLLRMRDRADEAVQLAGKSGYPVVLKIHSPQISHKTEVAGVTLDVNTDAEVRETYARMIETATKKRPDAEILGVTVQQMARMPPSGSRANLCSK